MTLDLINAKLEEVKQVDKEHSNAINEYHRIKRLLGDNPINKEPLKDAGKAIQIAYHKRESLQDEFAKVCEAELPEIFENYREHVARVESLHYW